VLSSVKIRGAARGGMGAAAGRMGRLDWGCVRAAGWRGELGVHVCFCGFLFSGPAGIGDGGLYYVLCDECCLTADSPPHATPAVPDGEYEPQHERWCQVSAKVVKTKNRSHSPHPPTRGRYGGTGPGLLAQGEGESRSVLVARAAISEPWPWRLPDADEFATADRRRP
jgi:hypothetical protein